VAALFYWKAADKGVKEAVIPLLAGAGKPAAL
jgi:hypothetical protein